MNRLKVWAPFAKTLKAQVNGKEILLEKKSDNWWQTAEPLDAATDYAFIVNNQNPVPDPRSPRQPQGIHGPSQTIDHSAFAWHDDHFQPVPLSSAVIYELHAGTFSKKGTFDGVIDHLDHLVDLGITHVEIMPVNGFSGNRGWGYDGVNLFAPHEAYGGPEGLKRLVDACHQKNLAVILDVVYNHLGPSGNYLEVFGPYFTDRYKTPWGRAVNLDGPESHEVRRFFCDNAVMWLCDYHIDGLRIDAVHAFADNSAVNFSEQLCLAVKTAEVRTGRHKTIIAESDLNDPRIVTPVSAGGLGMDAQWSDDFHHAVHAVLTGEKQGYYQDFGSIKDIARALTRVFVYDGRFSKFRRKHHGRPVYNLSRRRFLAYIQTHDQVGNRALGERLNHLTNPDLTKIGACLMLLSPFVPMLFQGQEWAASSPFLYFTDHQDEELAEAVAKGRTSEFASFGWDPEKIPDPQARDTFERSMLNWNEIKKQHHAEILNWYKQLILLRKKFAQSQDNPSDTTEAFADDQAGFLIMTRGRITLVCNLSGKKQPLPVKDADKMKIKICSAKNFEVNANSIILPPESAAVLYRE